MILDLRNKTMTNNINRGLVEQFSRNRQRIHAKYMDILETAYLIQTQIACVLFPVQGTSVLMRLLILTGCSLNQGIMLNRVPCFTSPPPPFSVAQFLA